MSSVKSSSPKLRSKIFSERNPELILSFGTFGAMQNLKGFGNSYNIDHETFFKDFKFDEVYR